MHNKRISLLILCGFAILVLTGCQKDEAETTDNGQNYTPGPVAREEVSYESLKIAKSEVTEVAKFFPVIVDGVEMEVIAVMATDGTIRTAFNACQVCADSGKGYYIQVGDRLICQNCGNSFSIDDLEDVHGGCNPAPITKDDKSEDVEFITVPKETFVDNMGLYVY